MSSSRGYGSLPYSQPRQQQQPYGTGGGSARRVYTDEVDGERPTGFGGAQSLASQSRYQSYQGYQTSNADSRYNSVCDEISSNLFKINNNSTSLERATKQIGTTQDSVQLRDKIHDIEQKTNVVISATTTALRELSSLCKNTDRQKSLQYGRLKNEFQETVRRYNGLQKKVAAAVKAATSLASSRGGGSGYVGAGNLIDLDDDNQLQQQQQQVVIHQQQKQQQIDIQDQILDSELVLIHEREARIHQLESDILDINQIFQELGTLVSEQGETIDTIESNVESAANYVESGRDQLLQAAAYQRKARKKMCILAGIVFVVIAIVVVIIVLSVKH